MFRELDETIGTGIRGALGDDDTQRDIRPWLQRHLGFFLWQLDGHHRVEDQHYFPLFRLAEPRLARGFEVLEQDHEALHRSLDELAVRANHVLRGEPTEPSFRDAVHHLEGAMRALGLELLRHLDDEEDLVVPLILEQGERTLLGPV